MKTNKPRSYAPTDAHYVPQLLLRGFATTESEHLFAFDKSTGAIFRSSIRNLACERGFYQLQDRVDPNRVDRWLTELEDTAGPIIRSLCARKTLSPLQPKERECLATFIAVQHIRTRQHREVAADINKQMANALRGMGTEPNSVKNFREFTESEMRESTIHDVHDLAVILAPHILNKKWLLLSAAPGTEFWIGDHPVVLANTLNPGDGLISTLGFAVPGIEIYLPIGYELTLGCLWPTIAANGLLSQSVSPTPRNDEFLRAFAGSEPLKLGAENMKYHNSLQAIRAERFIFSLRDNFDLLQEMLMTFPALRGGPRVELVGRPRHPTRQSDPR
jgi:hypothetical protein